MPKTNEDHFLAVVVDNKLDSLHLLDKSKGWYSDRDAGLDLEDVVRNGYKAYKKVNKNILGITAEDYKSSLSEYVHDRQFDVSSYCLIATSQAGGMIFDLEALLLDDNFWRSL